jgi:hypothetical protein
VCRTPSASIVHNRGTLSATQVQVHHKWLQLTLSVGAWRALPISHWFKRLDWREHELRHAMERLYRDKPRGLTFFLDNLSDEHGGETSSLRRRPRTPRQSTRPMAVSSPKRSSLTLNPPSNNSARSRRTSCVIIGSRARSLWCLAEEGAGGTCEILCGKAVGLW